MTSAVILAGGLGSRLRQMVSDVPKPMAPIAGRPFMEYQLDYCIAQGIRHFVLSVGYLHSRVIDHFGAFYRGVPIDYAVEEVPLGTGGGLLLATQFLEKGESFFLLNGDTFFAVDMKTLSTFARANDADWCLALFRTAEGGRYMAIEATAAGRITSLGGQHTDEREFLANGGAYWVHHRALVNSGFSRGERVSLESELLPQAMAAKQRLFGVAFQSTFIDIGVPHDYQRAATVLAV